LSRRLNLLRLVRFREWAHFLVLPLAGLDPSRTAIESTWPCIRGTIIAFCVLGFGYLLNAASDVGVDVDARKNPLLDAAGRRHVPQIVLGLAIAAMGLALLGPVVGWAATAVSLSSGFVYSMGPRVKAVPVVGTLANATNFVPLLWVGASVPDPPMARHLAPALAGLLLQSQLVHEAADAESDARAHVRTTFLVLGRWASAALGALFGVLLAMGGGSGWIDRLAILAVYGVGLPIALAVVAPEPSRAATLRRWHRWSGLVLGAVLFVRAT
jgi:4-hydroxybenzoate polyprenyltransferase